MFFPRKEVVDRIKAQYPAGCRVELISMSDRVLVVRDGRIDCELKGEQINEQEIIKRALGVNKDG